MPQADALVFTFDGFELDGTRFELRRDGERVAIEPQVLSLLLLPQPHRLLLIALQHFSVRALVRPPRRLARRGGAVGAGW